MTATERIAGYTIEEIQRGFREFPMQSMFGGKATASQSVPPEVLTLYEVRELRREVAAMKTDATAEVERLRAALVAYVELTERVWDANPDSDPGRWFSLPEYEAAIEVLGLPSKR